MRWQPDCNQKDRVARARMLRATREFFYQRQVLEVETPALSAAANTDPFIESFVCQEQTSHQARPRYLHTSPEYAMKRLLAAGSGDIYQICKVWRSEPSTAQHNAEFTMLEYYRLGFDLPQLMQEVNKLLLELIPSLSADSVFYSYAALFLEKFSINPHTVDKEELANLVRKHVPGLVGELDKQASLDLLLTHCIEPAFANDRLTFVYDYPASQSALAKTVASDANPEISVAKRFEAYVGSLELGNGYLELTSAAANKAVLNSELAVRKAQRLPTVPVDERFLSAMNHGLPDCSGIAIGLDRVLMLETGVNSLKEVLNFSWENA